MIFNSDIDKGLVIQYDATILDYFVQWKMLGVKDYALGLEPGNCHPDGRNIMREEDKLKYILPNEEKNFKVKFSIIENKEEWKKLTDK